MNSKTGFIEIGRRVLTVVLLAAALATYLTPAPALLRLAPVDFAAEQKREMFADDRQLPLADYIAKETKDRLVSVQGSEWETLFQAVNATVSGRPPNSTWSERRGRGWLGGDSVFFRLDEAPLDRVTGGMSSYDGKYLTLANSQPAQYLFVMYEVPVEMLDSAPPGLPYPFRSYSLWLALLALAVYVMLPRAKHPPKALVYSRLRAVLLPDLLGLFLFGFFFAMPLFVIPHVSSAANLFDVEGGWIYLTLFGWLFALFGIVMLAAATWYATYEILVLADRLRLSDLFRQRECPYREMAGVDIYTTQLPRWLIIGGFLLALFYRRALVGTMVASRSAHGIAIARTASGEQSNSKMQPLRIVMSTLPGTERLLQAFRQQKVPVTPEAEALLRSGI